MKKIKVLFSVFLLFAAFSLFAANEVPKVLCFGDSITQGTWIDGKYDIGNSWVNLLQDASKGKLVAINAGLSGRKTSEKEELLGYIKDNKNIDYVIVFLGVNDLCKPTEEVFNNCIKNTQWIIDTLRKSYKNVKITILSSPGLHVETMKSAFLKLGYDSKEQVMLDKLRPALNKLAKDNNCNYIDLWGVVSPQNYHDGLHPTIKGEKQIAEAVWSNFQKVYGFQICMA